MNRPENQGFWLDPLRWEPQQYPTPIAGFPLGQTGGHPIPFRDREYAHLVARQAGSSFRLRNRPHMPAALIRAKAKVMPRRLTATLPSATAA
jgi:hypothetical protein